jgi:hypothetical protein
VPAVQDTIVAVSSGWQAAPLGIVRLSGPDSFTLLHALGVPPPTGHAVAPCWSAARLRFDAATTLAATVFWFPAPRSYTGQNVVELHTIGCLPLLRARPSRASSPPALFCSGSWTPRKSTASWTLCKPATRPRAARRRGPAAMRGVTPAAGPSSGSPPC